MHTRSPPEIIIITVDISCSLFFADGQVNITWIYEDGTKHVGYIGLDWLRDNCYNTSMSYSQRIERNRPPVTVNFAVPCIKSKLIYSCI